MVADALGVELDEIVCEAEYAQRSTDVIPLVGGVGI